MRTFCEANDYDHLVRILTFVSWCLVKIEALCVKKKVYFMNLFCPEGHLKIFFSHLRYGGLKSLGWELILQKIHLKGVEDMQSHSSYVVMGKGFSGRERSMEI